MRCGDVCKVIAHEWPCRRTKELHTSLDRILFKFRMRIRYGSLDSSIDVASLANKLASSQFLIVRKHLGTVFVTRKCSLAVCSLWHSFFTRCRQWIHFKFLTVHKTPLYSLQSASTWTQSTQPYANSPPIPKKFKKKKMIHNRSNFEFQRKRNEKSSE